MAAYITNKKRALILKFSTPMKLGVVLAGHEVKAIRNGMGKLVGGHVLVRGGEAFLVGVNINPYQAANTPKNYDPGTQSQSCYCPKKNSQKLNKQWKRIA